MNSVTGEGLEGLSVATAGQLRVFVVPGWKTEAAEAARLLPKPDRQLRCTAGDIPHRANSAGPGGLPLRAIVCGQQENEKACLARTNEKLKSIPD